MDELTEKRPWKGRGVYSDVPLLRFSFEELSLNKEAVQVDDIHQFGHTL